jgi:hypothetical protein
MLIVFAPLLSMVVSSGEEERILQVFCAVFLS